VCIAVSGALNVANCTDSFLCGQEINQKTVPITLPAESMVLVFFGDERILTDVAYRQQKYGT
jgi:hypothetical protein